MSHRFNGLVVRPFLNVDRQESLIIGTRSDAIDPFDARLDLIAPPPTADGYQLFSEVATPSPNNHLARHLKHTQPIVTWLVAASVPVGNVITLTWDPGLIPAGRRMEILASDASGADTGTALNMASQGAVSATAGTALQTMYWLVRSREISTTPIGVAPEWNLLSLPGEPDNRLFASLFGGAMDPPARGWNGTSYIESDLMNPLTGYWLLRRQNTPTTVSVALTAVVSTGIPLQPGWNLVGPAQPTILPLPAPAVGSPWGWNTQAQSYIRAETALIPTMGYWVAALSGGVVPMQKSSQLQASQSTPEIGSIALQVEDARVKYADLKLGLSTDAQAGFTEGLDDLAPPVDIYGRAAYIEGGMSSPLDRLSVRYEPPPQTQATVWMIRVQLPAGHSGKLTWQPLLGPDYTTWIQPVVPAGEIVAITGPGSINIYAPQACFEVRIQRQINVAGQSWMMY